MRECDLSSQHYPKMLAYIIWLNRDTGAFGSMNETYVPPEIKDQQ
jgi:hypothetical protein